MLPKTTECCVTEHDHVIMWSWDHTPMQKTPKCCCAAANTEHTPDQPITSIHCDVISFIRLWNGKRSCFHGSSRHRRNKWRHWARSNKIILIFLIGAGGVYRDHFVWKKGHMTCETPVFCERAQSLKQRTRLKEKVNNHCGDTCYLTGF